MRWTYRTEHTPECDDTREIVEAHVTGYEWEYTCSCPERRYVDLRKPGPPSPIYAGYDAVIADMLSRPLFFSIFNKKEP